MLNASDLAGGATGAATGDGTTGNPDAGTATGAAETGKSYTQAEFDAATAAARRKAEKEAATLGEKAEKWDKLQAEQKSEAEKAAAAQKAAEDMAQAKISQANKRLAMAEVRLAAAAAGVRPEALDLVVKMLADDAGIEVDEKSDEVKGVKDALAALLKENEYLLAPKEDPKKPAPGRSGSDGFTGGSTKTIDEQIAEAEAKKDFKLSRALKLRKYEKAG